MAFTEFCCRSGGNNMNGGGIASGGQPATSPVYSFTNGAWSTTTHIYTPTSGAPNATVTVGDWAHVFVDGSTTPTRIARVSAVSSTTITLAAPANGSGTEPTTAASGISINVGGAWAGPSGSNGFPLNFLTGTAQDASNNRPRINLKNDQTYNLTAAITLAQSGPVAWSGYTTTFGDLGKATIDGGTTGASYNLVANGSAMIVATDLILQNNGATGSAGLLNQNTSGNAWFFVMRCVFAHSRGNGFDGTGGGRSIVIECEAYDCNQSNTANLAGFSGNVVSTTFIRCISHDNNAGANAHGFLVTSGQQLLNCISESNSGLGFKATGNTLLSNCDAYNNAGDGFAWATGGGTSSASVENCNFIKNGGYGINTAVGGGTEIVAIRNCGFGSGTMANTSGQTNFSTGTDINDIQGSVTYGSGLTPWVDPDNGDFRISLAAAKNAGRGTFMQTAASYAGTIAYPDIGAAQHLDSGGASTAPVAQLKSFGRGAPY